MKNKVCGGAGDALTLPDIMTHYKVTVIRKTVWYITKMDTKASGTEHSPGKKSHIYTWILNLLPKVTLLSIKNGLVKNKTKTT